MKIIIVKFTLADESNASLPENVKRQLGFNRRPVRAFEIDDDKDEQEFLKEVQKNMRKRFMQPFSLEIIKVSKSAKEQNTKGGTLMPHTR